MFGISAGGYGAGAPKVGGSGMDPVTMGALIGGAAGAGGGILEFGEARKKRKAEEAERKRMRRERQIANIQDTTQQGQAQRQASIGLLAQAAFDWASTIR